MTTSEFIATVSDLLDDPRAAGLRVRTRYDSAIGPTVTPPAGTLRAGGADIRGEFDMPDGTQAVTVDSWGSQASRMEAAVERLAGDVGFPLVRILDADGELETTSARLSHRHADATWRACRPQIEAAGVPFQAIQDATVHAADPLVRWFPTALLSGWWHSHVQPSDQSKATERRQKRIKALGGDASIVDALPDYAHMTADARSARLVTAEIVALGARRRHRMAAKVDTLFGPLKGGEKVGATSSGPSALGLGSLPPVAIEKAPVDVTFSSVEGFWYLSLAGLRFVEVTELPRGEAHALLIALAMLLRQTVQYESRLRAGTELVARPGASMQVLHHGSDPVEFPEPTVEALSEIVAELGERVGWAGPVDVVMPQDSILDRIRRLAEPDASA